MGDFNGHTSTKVNNQVVEPYGETRINDNGERLIGLCESYNLRITNGYFKRKMIHKYTWEQHARKLKSIIDYINVKQKSEFRIHDVRVKRDINCGSDRYVVRARAYLPIRGRTSNTDKHGVNHEKFTYLKYDLDSFQHDSTLYLYKWRLRRKTDSKRRIWSFRDLWKHNTKSLSNDKRGTAEKHKRQNCKMWWIEEIEGLVVKKKRNCIRNG